LLSTNKAALKPYWACYHTKLYNFEFEGIKFGIVACAVGASFIVLIAEDGNLVMEWRSWNLFEITDTWQRLTSASIDYVL